MKDDKGNKVKVLENVVWSNMIRRCYDKRLWSKHPTYKDCTVSENFKHHEYFYEWCQDQIGFGNKGWEIDKDLLVKGNKVYSEDTCVFLPRELNSLLINCKSCRGENPVGVYYHNRDCCFVARVRNGDGCRLDLGRFKTEKEAFYAYKEAKEGFIREQALKWKDKIDPRAYEALMNYQVDIDD
ncbi:TPA: hypothetical protein NNQ18_004556 [Salmonella enterica]|nr:hypothetical protein [Salmonella enterica]